MTARAAQRIVVTGRVQGVGFRLFVARHATALGLEGWVRNRRDGSVEILAIGDPASIERLVERCREGPALAEILSVDSSATADDGTIGFQQLPTA
jgi:acylphosphatase